MKNLVTETEVKNVLTTYSDMISVLGGSDLFQMQKEGLMQSVLEQVHHYKITKTGDGRWTTRVPDNTKPDGSRQIRKNSKTDLYNFLIAFYKISINKVMTVTELFNEWESYKKCFVGKKNKGLSQSSVTRYHRDYYHYISNTPIADMDINKVTSISLEQALVNVIISNDLLVSQYKSIRCFLPAIFKYAVLKNYITASPYDHVDTDRLLSMCTPNKIKDDEDRILTLEERNGLLTRVHAMQISKRNRAYMPNYAIELACYTGMRVGEIAALKWSAIHNDKNGHLCIFVDFAEKRIDEIDDKMHVEMHIEIGEPKNRKHRHIPVTPEISELLKRVESITGDYEYIFTNIKTGERYTGHDIGCACDRRGKESGIENASIHRIRRTVASILNLQSHNKKLVSAILGHTEEVDESNYDYDISDYTDKYAVLCSVSQKVTDFEDNPDKLKTSESPRINEF